MESPQIKKYFNDNGTEITETTFSDYIEYRYTNEEGNEIVETSDGLLIINGDVVAEPLSDIDKHSEDVIAGRGYFDSEGNYIKYGHSPDN